MFDFNTVGNNIHINSCWLLSYSDFCFADASVLVLKIHLVLLPRNFRTSSISITGKAIAKTKIHSLRLRGTVPNTWARNGMYKIRTCNPNETAMATRSHGLTQGGIARRLVSSESALRELNISMATKTESESVVAFPFPVLKYSQGSFSNENTCAPAVKGETVKLFQEEHFPQWAS